MTCVRDGTRPTPGFEDADRAPRVLEPVYESARAGSKIDTRATSSVNASVNGWRRCLVG